MKLDKKRPYGTVIGDLVVKFVQDGIEYRCDGEPVAPKQETLTLNKPNQQTQKKGSF